MKFPHISFPFEDQFTLRESDAVEQMRERLTDKEILLRWDHSAGKKLIKKSLTDVSDYLKRNPRGK